MPCRHLTDRSVSRIAFPELDPSGGLLVRPLPQSVNQGWPVRSELGCPRDAVQPEARIFSLRLVERSGGFRSALECLI